METRVFFSFDRNDIQAAKFVCSQCPVRKPCEKFYGADSLYVTAGKTKYERLLEQWHRITTPDEDNFA
jgi:hypothetical protein